MIPPEKKPPRRLFPKKALWWCVHQNKRAGETGPFWMIRLLAPRVPLGRAKDALAI
ncbi:hypothetical protein BQ8482_100172 [Mesorhizobium delmotii]|uniref:Uncharacterized protein n=1 Tax=Mesorhizobium delmotii TaxID=1631247 RepID=A0A2P9AA23_9HYPH|nr:hypothetical protein BQ8482_100172 [Mesorhizobium delmotii]